MVPRRLHAHTPFPLCIRRFISPLSIYNLFNAILARLPYPKLLTEATIWARHRSLPFYEDLRLRESHAPRPHYYGAQKSLSLIDHDAYTRVLRNEQGD